MGFAALNQVSAASLVVGGMAVALALLLPLRSKVLFVVGVLFVIVSALRPQWGTESMEQSLDESSLWVVVDVSRSMLTRDVGTSRLDRAKEIALKWLDETKPGEAGVVAFAGQAKVTCPLTRDRAFVRSTIEGLSIESAPPGGSNIESALANFPLSEQTTVLLLTDGGHEPIHDYDIGSRLRQADAALVVVGVGNPDETNPIPLDGDFLRTSRGELVQTSLADDRLNELARDAGGVYIPARTRMVDVADVFQRRLQTVLETRGLGARKPIERYQWFASAAVLAFCVQVWRSTRPRTASERSVA